MKQKKLYLISALFSSGLFVLFMVCFGVFLTQTNNYLGFESYIYWSVYQTALTIITIYQYKVSTYEKSTSLKMSLLFIVPLLLFILFILLNLGEINVHPVLFGIYVSLFTLTGLIYLFSSLTQPKN